MVALLVTYFLIAKAEIIITPTIKTSQTNFEVIISQKSNELRGTLMSKEVTVSDKFPVSNTDEEKVGKASGEIKIINEHTTDQTLIATTRFLTPDNFSSEPFTAILCKNSNSSILAEITNCEMSLVNSAILYICGECILIISSSFFILPP